MLCGSSHATALREYRVHGAPMPWSEVSDHGLYLLDDPSQGRWIWNHTGTPDNSKDDVAKTYRLGEGTTARRFEYVGPHVALEPSKARPECRTTPTLTQGTTHIAYRPDGYRPNPNMQTAHAFLTVASTPAPRPAPPRLGTPTPPEYYDSCEDHGLFIAEPEDDQEVWAYEWETRSATGELVQSGLGSAPFAIGNLHEGAYLAADATPDTTPPAFVPGQRYTMTVRAVGWDGTTSEPTTASFTFEQTGEGRNAFGLLLTLLLVGVGGFLVAGLVILSAGWVLVKLMRDAP